MPRKPSKTQERLEAIALVKGTKSLAEIWDEDKELDPTRVKEIQNEA